jgi:hypothetical protein
VLARLGGQGRVALGAILGAVVAALCCFGVLTAPSGDAAHADEGVPQAVSGVSAAAGHLDQPIAGVAVQGAVSVPVTTTPPTTTRAPQPPPPITTTTVPTTTVPKTTVPTTLPTFPHEPVPTFPHRHHCRWGSC